MDRKEKIIYWIIVPIVSAIIPTLLGWQTIARTSGWTPIGECPGTPIELSITSPGDGVTVPVREDYKSHNLYNTSFVFEVSRPISEEYEVGLLSKGENDSQYHLGFWWSKERVSPTIIRKYSLSIPLDNAQSSSVEVRAVLVGSSKGFGERYSDMSQITSNKSLIAISKPVLINFEK